MYPIGISNIRPEQISIDESDFKICYTLAEIELLLPIPMTIAGKETVFITRSEHTHEAFYNPIDDDSACQKLIDKYDVNINLSPQDGGLPLASIKSSDITVRDQYINRAVCLAVITLCTPKYLLPALLA
jgi:hypothetical protein